MCGSQTKLDARGPEVSVPSRRERGSGGAATLEPPPVRQRLEGPPQEPQGERPDVDRRQGETRRGIEGVAPGATGDRSDPTRGRRGGETTYDEGRQARTSAEAGPAVDETQGGVRLQLEQLLASLPTLGNEDLALHAHDYLGEDVDTTLTALNDAASGQRAKTIRALQRCINGELRRLPQ